MIPVTAKMKIEGLTELDAALKKMGPAVYRRVTRQAVRAGARPIITAARANLASRKDEDNWPNTGTTAKSIIAKVKLYPNRQVAVAIIGPGTNVSADVSDRRPHMPKHVPANIAHLIEYGHDNVRGGKKNRKKGGKNPEGVKILGRVPPHPFLKPAVQASLSQVMEAMKSKAAEGLEREAEKMKGKS